VIEIREMQRADLRRVHDINQENVPAVGSETFDDLCDIFDQCTINLVAVDQQRDGLVAGFCMCMPPDTAYDSPNYLFFVDRYDDFVYLDRVAITAGYQGRGIGPMLYREVESRTTAPLFTLEVNVKPLNEGSLRFHTREGFEEVAQLETRPGKIVSLMAKNLAVR